MERNTHILESVLSRLSCSAVENHIECGFALLLCKNVAVQPFLCVLDKILRFGFWLHKCNTIQI